MIRIQYKAICVAAMTYPNSQHVRLVHGRYTNGFILNSADYKTMSISLPLAIALSFSLYGGVNENKL